MLCSLLFCACGQKMEPPQDNAVTLSDTVAETVIALSRTAAETKETAGTEKNNRRRCSSNNA